MENSERDRKLEQWLDEALSEYSAAEPRLGLEQRVLNRVHSEEKTQTRGLNLWKWMPAFAAIAAAVILGVAIWPVTLREQRFTRTSADVTKRESPQQSDERVDRHDRDRLVTSPADKALAKKQVDTGVQGKNESSTETSPMRADSANVGLKDTGRASSEFTTNGNARVTATPPPPPMPGLSQGAIDGIVNQPSSAAGAANNGSTATQTVEVTSEQAAFQRNSVTILDQDQLPLKPASSDTKTAAEGAPTGIIAVESVSVTKETAALKKVRAKNREREQAAKARAEDANVVDVFGMRFRTDIRQAPAGPMQFPTPAPLSEQEKLVLAAAKKIKGVPVKQDAQGGAIPDVEIKEIEIKPLEGPKK